MSGHSKWATIKRQKGANDAKRGQLFTKLGNAISLAAKNGADQGMNPGLAMAVDKAKAANMPNANIERAIKRGSGQLGGATIEEYLFEGYGPGGAGIMVEAASDNRNRTTAEVRAAFSKNGGNLAESGSVAFQFTRRGLIRVAVDESKDQEELMLELIDAGADDVLPSDGEIIVYTDMVDLAAVRDRLKAKYLNVIEAGLSYEPNDVMAISDAETARKLEKLVDALDELDDVVNFYVNFDVADGTLD